MLSHRLNNKTARNDNYEAILCILNDCLQGSVQGLGFIFAPADDCLEDKRRGQHEVRRKEREQAGIANAKPLRSRSCGTRDTLKEMKMGLFHDQSKAHVFTFATQEDHVGFGRLTEKYANRLEQSHFLCSEPRVRAGGSLHKK